MASVEPNEDTASPTSLAPAARNAAIESVVPPTTTQLSGRPYSDETDELIEPYGSPGRVTVGSFPSTIAPIGVLASLIHSGYSKPRTSKPNLSALCQSDDGGRPVSSEAQ